jgi:hypothetical protein
MMVSAATALGYSCEGAALFMCCLRQHVVCLADFCLAHAFWCEEGWEREVAGQCSFMRW